MRSASVNPFRRQILVGGASALALPLVAWATPRVGVSVVDTSAETLNGATPAPSSVAEFAAQSQGFGEGQRLIFSGRLTDQQGEAIAGAVIELAVENLSTISDADGRFMMISTVPTGQMLVLRVAALAGQTHSKYIRLNHPADALPMPAHLDAVLADCRHEGERVWRSNFSIHLTA